MSNIDNTLYHNLEKNGMLSLTKSIIQNKLLDTLKSQSTTYSSLIKTSDQKINSNIYSLIRLSFSIISDFLSKLNLTYSLSAFNNESKDLFSNTFITYTESEIINLLNINIMEIEHLKKSILSTTKDSLSSNNGNISSTFLFYLLEKNSIIYKQDVESQTDSNLLNVEKKYNNNFSSIEEKLKQIEDKNNKKINLKEILSFQLTENKFIKYKEECDKRYEEQLNNEINRFKNFELSEMRIEENKKYSEKILKLREDYEKEFKEREERLKKELDELKERELQLEKEYEMKLNQERIKIENIINLLKNKENSFDLKYKNELDELKTQKESLKLKEEEIKLIKESHNSKIKNEIEKFKNDYDKSLIDKQRKIEEERENISQERIKLNNIFNKNNNFIYIRDDTLSENNDNNNNKEIINEIDSLKKDINDIKNKYSNAISDNSELKETIDKINRNIPIYQKYNQNNNNSTPLIENNDNKNYLNNKKEIPLEYQKMMEKNENEIKALKHSINQLKKEIKNNNKSPKNYNNIEDDTLYLSSGNFQNLNQTMPIKKSEILNQNKNIKNDNNQIKNQIQNQNKKISKLTPNILKKLADFQDRRKNLELFEQERYKLNSELRNQFYHIINEQNPIIIVNKEVIENKRKKIIYDNEYNKINYLDSLQNNYRIPNQKEQDREAILIDNKIPNEQLQNNIYNNNKQINNESYNKEISNNNNNKNETLENQESNKNEKMFNPIHKENSVHDHINNTRYENTNVYNSDDKNEKNNNNEKSPFESLVNNPSVRSNNQIKNSEYNSIENITNESKEIPKNQFSNSNSYRKNDINSQPQVTGGIGGILSNNYNKQPSNNSIQEEINESIVNSRVNNKSMNKFQNVDYQNYNDSENKDEIEEYNDFNYDVSGEIDKKTSNDKKNVGSNNKVNISNISGIMKTSMKESETATNFDKLIPLKKNNEIEENIDKDSMSYNDFETSNNLKKKGITGNSSSNNQVKTISEGEIQEEIINSESGET